jgi:hypothetical protein
LADGGFRTLGSSGALQLRATAGALAAALKRATKADRTYPAPGGGRGPPKGAPLAPPPPRLVQRLAQHAAMQAHAARSHAAQAALWARRPP